MRVTPAPETLPAHPGPHPHPTPGLHHRHISAASLMSDRGTAAGASREALYVGTTGFQAFLHARLNPAKALERGCGPLMARFHPGSSHVLLARGALRQSYADHEVGTGPGPAHNALTASFAQSRSWVPSITGVQALAQATVGQRHPLLRGSHPYMAVVTLITRW